MPATSSHQCPACKRRHVLYLPEAEWPEPERKFFYTCRAEGIAVRWEDAGEEWKPAAAKPEGAVVLNQF